MSSVQSQAIQTQSPRVVRSVDFALEQIRDDILKKEVIRINPETGKFRIVHNTYLSEFGGDEVKKIRTPGYNDTETFKFLGAGRCEGAKSGYFLSCLMLDTFHEETTRFLWHDWVRVRQQTNAVLGLYDSRENGGRGIYIANMLVPQIREIVDTRLQEFCAEQDLTLHYGRFP